MNARSLVCCIVILALALVAGRLLWPDAGAGAPRSTPTLHVGDVVRIAGTSTTCAVARRSGATVVECVPARRTAGSYGTLAGDRSVSVVRFRSAHVAKTVFTARQHGAARMCR